MEKEIVEMLCEADCFPSGYRSVSSVFFEKFEFDKPESLSDADISALIRGNVSHFQHEEHVFDVWSFSFFKDLG